MDDHNKRVIETALLCAQEPLSVADLTRLFVEDVSTTEIKAALDTLQTEWQDLSLIHI